MALNLNWINPGEYSFQTFLLLERFQIRLRPKAVCLQGSSQNLVHLTGRHKMEGAPNCLVDFFQIADVLFW